MAARKKAKVVRKKATKKATTKAKAKPKQQKGKAPQLNQTVQAGIIKAMEAGLKFPRAVESMGIKRKTGEEWLRRGEGRDDRPAVEPYATFATKIRETEAKLQGSLLESIKVAAPKDWKAARDLLRMLWPSEFGNMDRKTAQTKTEAGPRDPLEEALERRRLRMNGGPALDR